MSEFYLVDLVSQSESVRAHLRNKSREEILDWISSRGTLSSHIIYEREIFYFVSTTGLTTTFYFDGGELVIFGR